MGCVVVLQACEGVGDGGGGIALHLELAQGEEPLRLGLARGLHRLRPSGLAPSPQDAHSGGDGECGADDAGQGQPALPLPAGDARSVIARAKVSSAAESWPG